LFAVLVNLVLITNRYFLRDWSVTVMSKHLVFPDPDKLQRDVDAYFAHCDESRREYIMTAGDVRVRQEYPSMIGLAVWLGVCKDTLYTYIAGEDRPTVDPVIYDKISSILSHAKDRVEQSTLQAAATSDYNPKIAGLVLGRLGYTGQPDTEIGVTIKIEGFQGDYTV
jgi:hypothetical protein